MDEEKEDWLGPEKGVAPPIIIIMDDAPLVLRWDSGCEEVNGEEVVKGDGEVLVAGKGVELEKGEAEAPEEAERGVAELAKGDWDAVEGENEVGVVKEEEPEVEKGEAG